MFNQGKHPCIEKSQYCNLNFALLNRGRTWSMEVLLTLMCFNRFMKYVTTAERERESFLKNFLPLLRTGITYQSHCRRNKTNSCMHCQYIKYRSIVICGTIWLICCVSWRKTNKMHVEGTAKYLYKMMCQ